MIRLIIPIFVCLFLFAVCPAQDTAEDYALLDAVVQKNYEGAKKALDDGANINFASPSGWTPLMWAVKVNDPPMVRLLLLRGANRELKAGDGKTAMDMAKQKDDAKSKEIVRLIKTTDDVSGAIRAAKEYIKATPTPAESSKKERSEDEVLDELFQKKAGEMMAESLRPKEPKPEKKPIPATTNTAVGKMLLQAADEGDIVAVKKALDGGAFIDFQDAKGMTALLFAAGGARDDIIKLLLERGADAAIQEDQGLNAENLYEWTLLGSPPNSSEAAMLKTLQQAMEKSVKKAQDLMDTLVANDNTKAILLIKQGAYIDFVDRRLAGKTPLTLAVSSGNTEVVNALLRAGVRVNRRSAGNGTALYYAVVNKHPEMVPVLLKMKADPNLQGPNGVTPLMAAASNGYMDTVKLLLDNGADPELKSAQGKTALDIAKESKNNAVAELLSRSATAVSVKDETKKPLTVANAAAPVVVGGQLAPDSKSDKPKPTPTPDDANKLIEEMNAKYGNPADKQAAADAKKQERQDKYNKLVDEIQTTLNEPSKSTISDFFDPDKCTPEKSAITLKKPGKFVTAPKHDNPDDIAKLFSVLKDRKDSEKRNSENDIVLRDFLKGGVNPNVRDKYGLTPLMWAAVNDDFYAAGTLIDDGADINAQNPDGLTALMGAVLKDKEQIVLQLLESGARKDIRDKKGRTAYDIAVERKAVMLNYVGCKLKP